MKTQKEPSNINLSWGGGLLNVQHVGYYATYIIGKTDYEHINGNFIFSCPYIPTLNQCLYRFMECFGFETVNPFDK